MPHTQRTIEALLVLEPIKVWSLIITLFGDRTGASRATLTGKEIRAQLEPVGIRPDTVRVALHRLKKEGWIVASRQGREAIYCLSEQGTSETAAVYDDVYGEQIKHAAGWQLQLHPDEDLPDKSVSLSVFRHVELVPAGTKPASTLPAMQIPLDKRAIPLWVVDRIVPESHLLTAKTFLQIISELPVDSLSDKTLDTLALRLLLLHHWRRMALRDSTWFHIWLYSDGVFAVIHQRVIALLNGRSN